MIGRPNALSSRHLRVRKMRPLHGESSRSRRARLEARERRVGMRAWAGGGFRL